MNITEILQKYIDKESMDEVSENIWPDMLDAMKAAIDADRKQVVKKIKDAQSALLLAQIHKNNHGNLDHNLESARSVLDEIIKEIYQ